MLPLFAPLSLLHELLLHETCRRPSIWLCERERAAAAAARPGRAQITASPATKSLAANFRQREPSCAINEANLIVGRD